jgi:hypothetical protein
LHPQLLARQPQVVQVWLEPTVAASPFDPSQTQQILSLNGKISIDNVVIVWSANDTPEGLRRAFGRGCRLLIRLHAGHLFDVNERVFSAATDCLIRIGTTRTPGGVLEGWFFVQS